jgi:hypothetical protein
MATLSRRVDRRMQIQALHVGQGELHADSRRDYSGYSSDPWSACSSLIITSGGLTRPCGCLLGRACVALTTALRPWHWG